MATFDGQLYKGEDTPPERAHVQIEDGRCRLFTDRRRLGSWDLTEIQAERVGVLRFHVTAGEYSFVFPAQRPHRLLGRHRRHRRPSLGQEPLRVGRSGPRRHRPQLIPARFAPLLPRTDGPKPAGVSWRGVKAAAAAVGIGTLAVEAAYAVLRRVPFQEEFDASGSARTARRQTVLRGGRGRLLVHRTRGWTRLPRSGAGWSPPGSPSRGHRVTINRLPSAEPPVPAPCATRCLRPRLRRRPHL